MEAAIVIDFGSQYTRVLARKIREAGVYSIVIPDEKNQILKAISDFKIKGIFLSGGPASVYSKNAIKIDEIIFKLNIPVLGICYGMQSIAVQLGGIVKKTEVSEYGKTIIYINDKSQLFGGINLIPLNSDKRIKLKVWMSHGDSVVNIPDGFEITAFTSNNIVAAFENKEKKIYGVQFHPEVHHTEKGFELIKNFLFNICEFNVSWNLENFIEKKIAFLKDKIKDKKAIIAISGGVDSSVAAVLTYKAIGNNLIPVFVNHGLLRKNEENEVIKNLNNLLGNKIEYIDATNLFLDKLKGIKEPEKKRKIIGETFIRVFEKKADELKKKSNYNIKFLIQGTIYSDIIESAKSGKNTAKIKSHHNVGGLPENINFEIVEPLAELFKDEVRKLGLLLGIDKELIFRHPFPGPGLAIRIIGEITEKKLEILKEADHIFISTLKDTGWYDKVWQAFAVLTSIRTVGVVGDQRHYGYVIALRAVNSTDGMTADWSKLPYEILEKVSLEITNKIKDVGRVVFDISSKPPATIEWE